MTRAPRRAVRPSWPRSAASSIISRRRSARRWRKSGSWPSAHASALAKLADGRAPNAESIRKHGSALLEQINQLQQFTRRVLERLRPVGLAELGLRQALESLSRLWRESHPDVAIETVISATLGVTGETADLTIYRIVQEALTNVFRHAGATSVNVVIEPVEQAGGRGYAR